MSSSSQVPDVQWQYGAISARSSSTWSTAAFWRTSTVAITRSMSRPMARIPAPCIRRLCAGGLPQASGKVSLTGVQ